MNWNVLAALVLPVIAGPITYVVSEKAQKASTWLNRQPAITKQVATAALSALVTAGGAEAALLFPDGVVNLDNLNAQAVTTWAFSMATHGLMQAKAKKQKQQKQQKQQAPPDESNA